MGKSLYFILMPLVYEVVLQVIYYFKEAYDYCDDYLVIKDFKIPTPLAHFVASLIFDYIIVGIYILAMGKIVGVSMMTKDYEDVAGEFYVFVFFSGLFIIGHLITLAFCDADDELPLAHQLFLLACYVVFMFIMVPVTHSEVSNIRFNNMSYELVETYTINLHTLSEGYMADGKTQERIYVKGVVGNSYDLFYSFIDNDGSIIVRSIPYSEQYVKIYEQEDCETPRIVFKRYYKETNYKNDAYYTYDIYVPTSTIAIINSNSN